MKQLLKQLDELKQNYNIVGIKQSFEDEGVLLDDVITIRRITELCDLPTFVKIGGCEAKTDINNCIRLGIDNIIAPMVETPFALSKFIHCVSENENVNLMFVCESTTSHSNIKAMLDSPEASRLKGIVIGRSDLTKSFGLNKSEVDSEFISNVTKEIFKSSPIISFYKEGILQNRSDICIASNQSVCIKYIHTHELGPPRYQICWNWTAIKDPMLRLLIERNKTLGKWNILSGDSPTTLCILEQY